MAQEGQTQQVNVQELREALDSAKASLDNAVQRIGGTEAIDERLTARLRRLQAVNSGCNTSCSGRELELL